MTRRRYPRTAKSEAAREERNRKSQLRKVNEMKKSLTPSEKLRVAHAHLINGIEQHHIASLFGINSGRIAEAVKEVKAAVVWTDEPNRG